MPLELVTAAILGLVVFLGLAFRDPVVDRIAALDADPELVEPEDLD